MRDCDLEAARQRVSRRRTWLIGRIEAAQDRSNGEAADYWTIRWLDNEFEADAVDRLGQKGAVS